MRSLPLSCRPCPADGQKVSPSGAGHQTLSSPSERSFVQAEMLLRLLSADRSLFHDGMKRGRDPTYLESAIDAHERAMRAPSAIIRSDRSSGFALPRRFAMPVLPSDWTIVEQEQLEPADEIAWTARLRLPSKAQLFLFATSSGHGAPDDPQAIRCQGRDIAFWCGGSMSFAAIANPCGATPVW